MRKPAFLATVAAVGFLSATPASSTSVSADENADATAQPVATATMTQSQRRTTYDANFFAQYAPRTALDITRRVPGFSLDIGNSDVRGFAGAAGNVVINGARPSSKSENLEQVLARIPAQQVSRVEVGPGDLFGADYAGKTQVLNIVVTAGARGLEGNVTAAARRYSNGVVVPTASATTVLHRGASDFNLSAGIGNNDNYQNGPDYLYIPADGPLVERRFRSNHYISRAPFAAASWALGSAADNSSHVNVRYQATRGGVRQKNHVTPVASPEHDDRLIQDYREPTLEVGGDIARPLGHGAIKLVGLFNRRNRDYEDIYIGGEPAPGGFHQVQDATLTETIGRLSWTRADLAGFSLEAGAETAFNKLDNSLTYALVNADGSERPVDLPIDNATVSEKRVEGYVSLGRALSSSLHIDVGLRYETSTLKVRGDARADRSLSFWKPDVALDWNDSGWHARLSLRRTVAQLNFYDFISAADIAAGRVNGGNANLVPQQTWESRFTLEHPLLASGLVKLDLGYDRVHQLQDRVPTDEGLDAPGNLGTGTRSFAALSIDAPLDRVGVKGGRLKLDGTLQRTRVTDPISHEPRHWTDFWPSWQWNAEYRQDLGAFSYGATLSDRAHYSLFRTDEIDVFANAKVYATAFAEYRPNAKTTITLDIDNALDTRFNWLRTLYIPNRTNPLTTKFEARLRNSHPNIGLTVKRTL
jgi:hypothetical protein